MIAVQGPNARAKVQSPLTPATREKAIKIGKFVASKEMGSLSRAPATPARTATRSSCRSAGRGSVEPLIGAGVAPAGLGARDTLRL
jgi:aminomethyltransferase